MDDTEDPDASTSALREPDGPAPAAPVQSADARVPWGRGAAGLVAVAMLCSLFIASYVGALHAPQFHGVPVAVSRDVPAQVRSGLARGTGIEVVEVADREAAQTAIDDRSAYASLTPTSSGALLLTIAPAASPTVAQSLATELRPKLARQTGTTVELATTHALPTDDGRGLVGFYTALGWIVAGYLGATILALAFGSAPPARRTAARLIGVAALGVVMGILGAVIAGSIGGVDHGTVGIIVTGALTTYAVGAATVALQGVLGMLGTGAAILLFVVIGNPSAGGASATELLPQPWRAIGPLLPNGAATSAVRDLAYFPDASIGGQLLVLAAWAAVGTAVALLVGAYRPGLTRAEAEASIAGVA